jgi:TonB-dependent starch-binding outer membrane protein SusC
MQYTSTFPSLRGLVLLAAAGLCSVAARAEVIPTPTGSVLSTRAVVARITGKVVDENGDPLPGATVMVKGTSDGVVTNAEGVFVIEADMGSTLVITYLGFATQEVAVTSANVDVKLIADASTLGELVVVGYGDQTKADVTGSIAQIKEENFRQGINTSADNLIQGKVAGVRVVNSSGEPGAGMDVVIRGVGSVRSGSTPLFVVDGVPLSNDNVSPAGASLGFGTSQAKNPLNFLNASDIASINVLKDASAAAIYGARGANGVVIITTKKGAKGKGTLTADSYVGFSSVIKKLDLLDAAEFRHATNPNGDTPKYDWGSSTDWQDVIFRTAVTNNQSLSFGKSTNSGDYFVSLGRMEQQGIVGNSNFKRLTARINASESFLDDERLKVSMHLTASETRDRAVPVSDDGGADGHLITQMLQANPTFPVYDTATGGYYNFNSPAYYNPAYLLTIYDDITTTTRVLGNIETSFRIIDGLEYKLNMGIDRSLGKRDATIYPNVTDRNPNGLYNYNSIEATNTLIEHYLTYGKQIGRSKLDLLAGFSYQKFQRSGISYRVEGFAKQGEGVPPKYNPAAGGKTTIQPGYNQENELQSYFGRVNYSYNEKYMLTASMRADGSTRFGENNKYGYFPSFAAGWILSKENFLAGTTSWLESLKMRASWGQTGNQDVQNKVTKASYSVGGPDGYYLNNDLALVNGLTITRTVNPNLKWEVSTQYDLGVDFGLMGGRLYGTVDYFNKTTTDAILFSKAQPLEPTENVWINMDGKIVNTGVELMLGYQILNTDQLKWSVDINGATLHNEIKDLPVSEIYTGAISGTGLSGVTANIYKSGYAAGSFFMYEFLGFDKDGKETYKDQTNDGKITPDDRIVVEGALPKFSYALNTQANYKNFDLSLSFTGQAGGKLINNTNLGALNIGNLNANRNTLNDIYESGASPGNSPTLSTQFLESSNFFRLNSARVGYTLRTERLPWLDNATLYVTGQNLFTITNYSGYDPLINSPKSTNGNQSIGVDYPRYPTSRTFTVGLTVKL